MKTFITNVIKAQSSTTFPIWLLLFKTSNEDFVHNLMLEMSTIVFINCIEHEFSSVCMLIKMMAISVQKWPVNKEVLINDVKMLMRD